MRIWVIGIGQSNEAGTELFPYLFQDIKRETLWRTPREKGRMRSGKYKLNIDVLFQDLRQYYARPATLLPD